jgi:hypothetical protein
MKTLISLTILLLSTSVLANPNDAVLKSLTYNEGRYIGVTLVSNPNNLSTYTTEKLQVKAYPSYKYDGYSCRDITIAKGKNFGNMSACKVGGDWIFIYPE